MDVTVPTKLYVLGIVQNFSKMVLQDEGRRRPSLLRQRDPGRNHDRDQAAAVPAGRSRIPHDRQQIMHRALSKTLVHVPTTTRQTLLRANKDDQEQSEAGDTPRCAPLPALSSTIDAPHHLRGNARTVAYYPPQYLSSFTVYNSSDMPVRNTSVTVRKRLYQEDLRGRACTVVPHLPSMMHRICQGKKTSVTLGI